MTKRIAVCGYGRHGKESTSRILSELTGLCYTKSTSEAAAELVFSHTQESHGYETVQECWNDRHQHRSTWAKIIWDHNKPLGITLYADMVRNGIDILDGIRQADEIAACVEHGIVDLTVWVDASKRKPIEDASSCTLGPDDCQYIIDNNGTIEQLRANVIQFAETHFSEVMS